MKRENKIRSSLYYEKHLFSFYLKHRLLSIKFIVCLILSLIDIFLILNQYNFRNITTQFDLDEMLYWEDIIEFSIYLFLRLIPIIIVGDMVSGEFSNKSAMIIYATESRNKILAIKLFCVVISIFILMLFYFSTFLIMIFIRTDLLVSIDIFLMGFLIVFIQLIFISSLTFMISALTRNVVLSFILPFFYVTIELFLEDLELGLLSYSSYTVKVINFFYNLIFYDKIVLSTVTIICIIVFFGLSILIMLITFYAFKQLDIRVD